MATTAAPAPMQIQRINTSLRGQRCGVCGKQATNAFRQFPATLHPTDPAWRDHASAPIEYRCDDHAPKLKRP